MISPTLLDVAAITGLPPNAETVHPFASVPEFSDPWPSSRIPIPSNLLGVGASTPEKRERRELEPYQITNNNPRGN